LRWYAGSYAPRNRKFTPVLYLNGRLDGRRAVIYHIPREENAMALDPELLAILACPYCKADVKETEDGQGLKCVECHRVYPIEDEIPVMLIDEASIEPERRIKD